ncbi:MAG: GNAT family N-acetyltransferase [Verrucomicrobiota bacterium]|nr:GNAT family N-acetyltransferase [Verrucomicrobiota bacterium]
MSDLLVRLYELPPCPDCAPAGYAVRRAFAAEKRLVTAWIAEHFGHGWASEVEAAFAPLPVSCFVAARANAIEGFACYDATARGFFGPTGVAEGSRRLGLGRMLLLRCLHDMTAQGYAYAIIGAAGATEFYQNTVNAIEIADSTPGFYRGSFE